MGERRTKSPGVTRGFPLATSPCGRPRTLEASRVSGHERHAKDSETGRGAVVAAHSTAEGGEVRPKRPTGGKAPSGRASAGRRQGRDFELTTPDHGTPGDCGARWVLAWAADALPEEPYALIAHVRVCGGAGWVTTGSTRHCSTQVTLLHSRDCLFGWLCPFHRPRPRGVPHGSATLPCRRP
jgi:hypothetical protein